MSDVSRVPFCDFNVGINIIRKNNKLFGLNHVLYLPTIGTEINFFAVM